MECNLQMKVASVCSQYLQDCEVSVLIQKETIVGIQQEPIDDCLILAETIVSFWQTIVSFWQTIVSFWQRLSSHSGRDDCLFQIETIALPNRLLIASQHYKSSVHASEWFICKFHSKEYTHTSTEECPKNAQDYGQAHSVYFHARCQQSTSRS